MREQVGKQHMTTLAALILFGIFAVSVLSVLLAGAGAYRRLTARDQAGFERRTLGEYLTARVRQADVWDRVTVEDFSGAPALRLADEDGYVTWVYVWDGWLMELYTSEESELGPEAGSRLIEAHSLELKWEEDLLEIKVSGGDGSEEQLYLAPRSGGGAA